MYMYAGGINFVCFYDFFIWYWNCSISVVYIFVFHFNSNIIYNTSQIYLILALWSQFFILVLKDKDQSQYCIHYTMCSDWPILEYMLENVMIIMADLSWLQIITSLLKSCRMNKWLIHLSKPLPINS